MSLEESVKARMIALNIHEKDIDEQFIRGSGAGGQKINKTSSCVQLHHKPSGIIVRCQRERSQSLNRLLARRMLCDKIEQRILGALSKIEQEREKLRRQKRKRSKRAKEKMLKDKAKRSEKKRLRSRLVD